MVSFRSWLSSFTATGSQRSKVKSRKAKTGRTWIAQGVERLESRAMFACLPASDLALAPADIDENMAPGTTVGQFSTTDADSPAGPFVYSFQGGPENLDNEHFFLTGDVIKTRASLDFESISSYQVSIKSTDPDGNQISKSFTITVNDLQEAPLANDDAVLTTENTPVSGNVLANDTDDEGDVLVASLASEPANGMVELAADGSFTYTPNADYIGSDTFTYMADDGQGGTAVATVTITIDPLNDAPAPADDEFVTDEDTPVSGNVLVNDVDVDGDAFNVTLGEAPANGAVELNSDGSFTYTPNADYNGPDSFTYMVDDGQGASGTGTVLITVNAINDNPVAGNDEFATDEEMPVSGNVLENDSDVDGDSLLAALVDGPANGAVEFNADGSFTYTPNADFSGSDSFTYMVDDGQGGSAIGTVAIAVASANDAPVAANDEFAGDEDMPISGNVLENDTDIDGDSLTAALAEGPTSGVVEMNSDGSFTYTPNADFNGSDSFTYTVDDGQGGTATGTVTISLAAINDAPVAGNDEFATDEETPASGNVLENDSDVDGDSLTAALAEGPTSGVVELNSDGSFTYTPNAEFSGSDSFTYMVEDGQGGSALGTVSITVAAVNDAPVAGNDAFATDEDMPLSGNVLVNDTDIDGDAIAATLDTAPANGTVELNSDGSFTYTPNADFNGSDSFTYLVDDGHGASSMGTVTIDIAAINDAPVAGNDEVATDEDTAVSGNVLENDSDVDGDGLTAALADGPTSGTVELNSDGSFTYTPNADFNGSDSFTYLVDDGQGGSAVGTVSISVAAANDGPVAVNDELATDEDMPVSGNVLSNDSDADGDSLLAELADGPTNGEVVLNADGSFTYTPSADFNGSDSFTYVVHDGQGGSATGSVMISIAAINDAPVAGHDELATDEDMPVSGNVLENDSDVDGDSLTAELADGPTNGAVELNSDGSFTYTPSADFYGVDTFTYTVSDGNGGSALGTVTITVNPANDEPAPGEDHFVTDEDIAAVIPISELLANDGDIDGDLPTFVAAGGAVNGTVAVDGDNVVFTPNADFNGTGSFTYAVDDGNGGIAFASVTITVNPVADAPIAGEDAASTEQGVPLTIPASDLLANDTDADGDTLTVTAVGGATGGTVSLVDGNVTYTPSADFAGTGTFHYLVSDGNGGSAVGRVVVEVTAAAVPENTPPEALADTMTAVQDTEKMIAAADLLANDFDADGDMLSLIGVGDALGGSVSLVDDEVSFVPQSGLVGLASFTYTISDGRGGVATGTVTLDVIANEDRGPGEEPAPGEGEECPPAASPAEALSKVQFLARR